MRCDAGAVEVGGWLCFALLQCALWFSFALLLCACALLLTAEKGCGGGGCDMDSVSGFSLVCLICEETFCKRNNHNQVQEINNQINQYLSKSLIEYTLLGEL